MWTRTVFFVVFWAVVAVAEQKESTLWGRSQSCFSGCSVTGLQKLFYIPSHVYTYTYVGRSEVTMEGIKDATADLDWEMEVDFAWINSCDVILTLRNPKISSETADSVSELLSELPLAATVSEGVVQGVCAHPDEAPESLNLKKGIIASLQNSLPSLSLIHSGKTYTELDVVGMCPTHYTVEAKDSKYVITKFKNHHDCSQRISQSSESLLNSFALKSPLPLKSSSNCVQDIEDGVIRTVSCEDVKEIRPTFTSSKFVKTKQVSELKFKRKMYQNKSYLNITDFRRTNLLFEDSFQPMLHQYVTEIRSLLEKLCLKVHHGLDSSSPKLTAQLIRLLNKIPLEDFEKTYEAVRSRKICPNSVHAETILLDILAFIDNEGALKLMVDLILQAELSGYRNQLYMLAFFTRNNLSHKSMEFLVPVFESPSPPSVLMLSAGHLIHKYCQIDSECRKLPALKKIFRTLSDRLAEFCQKEHFTDQERYSVLGILKSIGNIGRMRPLLEDVILECISRKKLDTIVRVTGIQSFRLVSCTEKQEHTEEKLMDLFQDSNENSELRIEAYLAVIRCSTAATLGRVVETLKYEKNLDVKSFIMSNLRNVITNQFPSSPKLKEAIYQINLPDDYERTVSQSLNIGYFSKSLGTGMDTKAQIIADKRNNFRKYDVNFLAGLFNKILNLGEISSRVENTPSFFKSAQKLGKSEGKESVFSLKALNSIAKALFFDLSKKNVEGEGLRSKSDPIGNLSSLNSEWDLYFRLLETEILFLSVVEKEQEKSLITNLLELLFTHARDLDIRMLNTTRAVHANFKIFIPTIQGIPLLLKTEATSLFGMNILVNSISPFDEVKPLDNDLIFSPEFSSEIQSLIGFSFGAKSGIRNKININLSTGVQTKMIKTGRRNLRFIIEKSKKALETWTISSHVYLFKKLPKKEDTQIIPKSFQDPRITKYSCLPPKLNFFNSKTCWNFNVTDIFTSKIFPFGNSSTVKFYFETEDPTYTSFQIDSSWRLRKRSKTLNLEFGNEGDKASNRDKVEMSFSKQSSRYSMNAFISSKRSSSDVGIRLNIEDKSTKFGSKMTTSVFAAKSKQLTSKDQLLFMTYAEGSESQDEKSTIDFELKTLNKLSPIINTNIKVSADVHFMTSKDSSLEGRKQKPLQEDIVSYSNNDSFTNFFGVSMKKSLGTHFKDSLRHQTTRETLFCLPVDFTIHKLEVELGSGDLQTRAFLRRVSFDKKASQYRFLTTLEGGRSLGGARILGDIAFRGYFNGSMVITSKFNGKFEDSHKYETRTDFSHNIYKTEFNLEVENMSAGSKIALMRYSKSRKFLTYVNMLTEAELTIPQYIPHWKIKGTITEVQTEMYQISYSLKRENVEVMHVEGPITVHIDPRKVEEEVRLNVTGIKGGPYYVTAGYFFSLIKSRTVLEIQKSNKQVFAVKMYLSHPDQSIDSVKYEILFPETLNIEGGAKNESSFLETNFDIQLFPNSTSEREFVGHGYINQRLKTVQGKIISDAQNKNKNHKIIIDGNYDISLKKRFFSLRGDADTTSGKYSYEFETNLGSPAEKDTYKHFLFNITKPDKSRILLELFHHDKVFNTVSGDVTNSIQILTLGGKLLKIRSNFCYLLEPASQGFHIAGQINASYPGVENVNIKIESKTKLLHVETGHSTNKQVGQISNIKVRGTPSEPSNLIGTPERPHRQRDLEIRIEMIFPSQKLRNVTLCFEKSTKEAKIVLRSFKNSEIFTDFQMKFSNNESLGLAELYTTSKTTKIHPTVSLIENSVNLFPNKEWSTVGHVLGGRYYKGAKYIYEGLTIYRSLKDIETIATLKQRRNLSDYSVVPQTSVTGAIEVEWPDEKQSEKISFSIESIEVAKGSNKTEIILRAPSFSSKPRILVETTFTPLVKSVTVTFQHEVDRPPSSTFSGTFSSPTDAESNFYGFIKTPKREVEFTSSLAESKAELPFSLVGSTFNGTLKSSSQGTFDFYSTFCRPAYVEGGANKRGRRFVYMGKLGAQEQFTLFAVDKRRSDESSEQCPQSLKLEKKIGVASVSLYSPTILHLDFFYNFQKLKEATQAFLQGAKILGLLSNEMLDDLWEDVVKNTITNSSSRLSKNLRDTYNDISSELKEIHENIKGERWFSEIIGWFDKVIHSLQSILDSWKRTINQLRKQLSESLHNLFNDILKMFDEIDHAVRSILQELIKYVEQVRKAFEVIETDWDVLEALMKYIRPSVIWKFLQDFWTTIYAHLSTEISILKHLSTVSVAAIEHEMECIWNLFLGFYPSVQNLIIDIKTWIYGNTETSSKFLKKILEFYLTRNEGSIDVKLPLKAPVHSVTSAIANVGFPKHFSTDYFEGIWITRNIWQAIRLKSLNKK